MPTQQSAEIADKLAREAAFGIFVARMAKMLEELRPGSIEELATPFGPEDTSHFAELPVAWQDGAQDRQAAINKHLRVLSEKARTAG